MPNIQGSAQRRTPPGQDSRLPFGARTARAEFMAQPSNSRQAAHDLVQRRLALEADAGAAGERDETVLDAGVVGESAEIAEHAGVGFRAAEAKAGGKRQRHLVAAVRQN